ncbi:uncharacterized protein (TIGR00255 family) [Oikeobacillus pervagus]|uniref:Uncharacterized protein (TIGR00255 family) n=1 Tax=Oikeobacillus pervagus TaxID=1325931 RepID=A0AAJ1WJ59_9BACI|nr:YicC/YloC family endoribonuclease [Oikeobacillus pervagus]MDQ0215068.1 uncharacterized protein (TIGR00255 family) [Oikeobacillus pervagus]
MVMSMTGFGRDKKQSSNHAVTVEMKTVNHRFSEFYIRMPRQLMNIEDKIKKRLNEYIKRGRVEVFVTIEGGGLVHHSLHVDWDLIQEYYQIVEEISSKLNVVNDVQLKDILARTDLITIEELEEENEELEQLVLEAAEEAVKKLVHMRKAEGNELKKDLLLLMKQFQSTVQQVKSHSPVVVEQYRERLEKKIKELTDHLIEDQSRILTEVAIFADKSDIHEECTRLESHISQFLHTLEKDESIGRRLDFMIQEMNREVNTIGSKANSSEIATKVVDLKTCLEKMREQIQNIE